jgi:drug/metabolite transporter (DMT)-like permease
LGEIYVTASTLLIISAAFHALWNFWLKRSRNKTGTALAIMVVATLLNTVVSCLSSPVPNASTPLVLGIVAAGLCEGFYFYLLNTAYAQQAMGVAYTIMRGGAMVLVWLIATLTLGEAIELHEVFLVCGILCGIALIQRSFRARDLLHSGAYAAYICAVCIAGYHIAYGAAVRTGATPAFVFSTAMACGVATYSVCGGRQALLSLRVSLRDEPQLIALAGVACGLSFLLFITALATVDPGRAISLRNTSVAFGAVLSLIAGEQLTRIQWLGVILVGSCVVGLI